MVVIGAGLGGLRTVERLRAKGYRGQLTLVGAERHAPYDRPPLTKQVLRGERDTTTLRNGVRVHTGVAVGEVLGDDRVTGLVLTDGTRLPATQAVAGLGLVPALDWLDGSGLHLDDGIVCDAAGRTSAPDVYAVGDAARWHQPRLGEHRRVEHWTTTTDQATTVAAVLTGQTDARLDDVPYFWSDQFDVKIQALGFVDPTDTVRRLDLGGRTVLLYGRDGRLTAVVGFSAAKHVMRLRTLISSGAQADEAAALLTAR